MKFDNYYYLEYSDYRYFILILLQVFHGELESQLKISNWAFYEIHGGGLFEFC